MGLTDSQIQAILSLLETADEEIVSHLRNKLHELGPDAVRAVLAAASSDSIAAREAERVLVRLREPSSEDRFRALIMSGDADLEEGVIAIARFGYPDLHPTYISSRLDRMAAELDPNVAPDDHPVRVIRTFNEYLFETCGFEGSAGYSQRPDPDDSYLNRVLQRKRGLPIALAALYILLGRRIDVPFEGVNTPNHFLVKLPSDLSDDDGPEKILLDPFRGGRILTRNECADVVGRELTDKDLEPVSDRRILARMLANLVSACTGCGQRRKAERIILLMNILNSEAS